MGVSAGGYIARLAALHAIPRPVAVLSLFGMGGDFFTDHVVAIKATPIPFEWAPVSEEAVIALGSPKPIAEDKVWFSPTGIADEYGRVALAPWWWKQGNLLDHLVGEVGWTKQLRSLPYEQRAGAVPEAARDLFPELLISAEFPPTFLAHGDADTMVLLGESQKTYKQLQEAGVRSELRIVAGADHGFMKAGAIVPEADGVHKEGFEFLAEELRK